MPTSAEESGELLVDASVAIAVSVADHSAHEEARAALADRKRGLAGHAAFESYSVLTRLPPPNRRSPADAARILERGFPSSRFLEAGAVANLLEELEALGIAGGAVYDALVGAVAVEHDLPLLTLDHRALDTYRALGVKVQLLGGRP